LFQAAVSTGTTYTGWYTFQFRDVNCREHVDSQKLSAPRDVSAVTTTVVPGAGAICRRTYTTDVSFMVSRTGHGVTSMS
jgi:hypothetical protein